MIPEIPHLRNIPPSKQLYVNGKPFLIRGAELQNSSMTSADYVKDIWPRLVETNVNTVLGCVTWLQTEPMEGNFDFDELDRIIEGARQHNLRLILLWFGSFKNVMFLLVQTRLLTRHS
jgi:beta-galactosidase GanA